MVTVEYKVSETWFGVSSLSVLLAPNLRVERHLIAFAEPTSVSEQTFDPERFFYVPNSEDHWFLNVHKKNSDQRSVVHQKVSGKFTVLGRSAAYKCTTDSEGVPCYNTDLWSDNGKPYDLLCPPAIVGETVEVPGFSGYRYKYNRSNDIVINKVNVQLFRKNVAQVSVKIFTSYDVIRRSDNSLVQSYVDINVDNRTVYLRNGHSYEPDMPIYHDATFLYSRQFYQERLRYLIDKEVSWWVLALKAAESIRSNVNLSLYMRDWKDMLNFKSGKLWQSFKDVEHLVTSPRSAFIKVPQAARLAGQATQSRKSMTVNGVNKAAILQAKSDEVIESLLKDYAKVGSNMYLSNHYGLKLQYSDSLKLSKQMENSITEEFYQYNRIGSQHSYDLRLGNAVIHGERRFCGYIHNTSLEERDFWNKIQAAKRRMYEFDATLSLENLWDFIPYSFVIDWFIPIGNFFHDLEAKNYMNTLRLCVGFYTDKGVITEDDYLSQSGGHGQLTTHYYQRRVNAEFPPEEPYDPGNAFDHWKRLPTHFLEAGTLLIQRLL